MRPSLGNNAWTVASDPVFLAAPLQPFSTELLVIQREDLIMSVLCLKVKTSLLALDGLLHPLDETVAFPLQTVAHSA